MKKIFVFISVFTACTALTASAQTSAALRNRQLTVRIGAKGGAYEILSNELPRPVLISGVGAEVNHQWVNSSEYPHHQSTATTFEDTLGSGHALKITFSGLANKPDLVCILHLYDNEPYGDVQVDVRNVTSRTITVQDVRDVDAVGKQLIDLGASEKDDRVLAEIVSENPSAHIGSLAQARHGEYVGVRDDLIYNMTTKKSLLFAALTTKRFLTVLHLRVGRNPSGAAHISSFTVDSTGTTKMMLDRDQIPPNERVYLSLPVAPGKSLPSEVVMFAAGPHYLQQLENYGKAVRRLHHLHFPINVTGYLTTKFELSKNRGYKGLSVN